MFLWFELSFDLLTCINRLDVSINLSTEITELVSLTALADFWSLKGKTILTGASRSNILLVLMGNKPDRLFLYKEKTGFPRTCYGKLLT